MTEKEEPEEANVPECGRQLRRTREKLGLSVDDVAAELRLSGFQIQALEDDDWRRLPGATYARGYLRSYARLIGLDADQLMAGASTKEIEITRREPQIAAAKREARAPEDEQDERTSEASGGLPWRWVAVIGVVAVMAVGFWQYREAGDPIPGTTDTEEPETAQTEEPGTAQTGSGSRSEEIAREEAERSTSIQGGAGEGAPEPGRDAEDTVAADEGADYESVPMPTVPGKAVFQFEDRSWIDVRDASGERLLYRSFPAGRRVEIQGRPPFHVYVGNARAVRVEYMGDVVTPDTGPERLYARLVLDGSSG